MTNNIVIKAEKDQAEKSDIEAAMKRNWFFHNQDIKVSVSGNKVTLNGRVNSFYAKDEAEQIAWNAAGICAVANDIVIVNAYAD